MTQQQLPDERGNNQQPQSSSDLGDSGDNQHLFHVAIIRSSRCDAVAND
jgi:hypothetical protein